MNTKYLKSLERQQAAAQKVIDDLTRENYELRSLLREATPQQNKQHETRSSKAAG